MFFVDILLPQHPLVPHNIVDNWKPFCNVLRAILLLAKVYDWSEMVVCISFLVIAFPSACMLVQHIKKQSPDHFCITIIIVVVVVVITVIIIINIIFGKLCSRSLTSCIIDNWTGAMSRCLIVFVRFWFVNSFWAHRCKIGPVHLGAGWFLLPPDTY